MATGTANSTAAPPRETERFIERQLRKTRRQVRLVDLASSLMGLVAGVLGYLLVLALMDHWLVELTPALRWLAWAGLLAGAGWYLLRYVVPPLLRPISPLYAAKAIEEATPTLKNSLINFLFFRADRAAVNEAIYDALEQRAASDLTGVPIEDAVDRSRVIVVGYLLAGMLALGALYKILSPKDPFPSASRVVAPWAEIQRPSRVQIVEVEPGDATVFQGERVTISAAVRGNARSVILYYSTADGELTDQPVPMTLASGSLRHECSLPPGEKGMQRELLYHIAAGDAKTGIYRLRVSPAPHIIVERLEYDFPQYTRRPRQALEGQGDISALEGTRVTIRARANQPIRSAYLELDPHSGASQRVPMEVQGEQASRTLVLQLQSDRRTPQHQAYQVRFVAEGGHESRHPVLHKIEVTPDLPPEIAILTPTKETVEVPVDGAQTLEFRALDPDFGLSAIRLRAVTGGTELVAENLFDEPAGTPGQIVRKYVFRPAALQLQPGDRVVYRGIAEDNRIEPGGSSPAPNQARTKDHVLLIVPPAGRTPEGATKSGGAPTQPQEKPSEREGEPGGEQNGSKQGAQGESASGESGSEQGDQAGKEQSGEGSESQQAGEGQTKSGSQSGAGAQAPAEGDNAQTDGGQPQPGQANGGTRAGGNTGQQDPQPGQAGGSEPGSAEPLHDGEVFEKALQRLKQEVQQGGRQGKGQPAAGDEQAEGGDPGEPQQTGGNDSPAQGTSRGDAGEGSSEQKFPTGDEKTASKTQSEPLQGGEGARHKDNNLGAGAQQQAAPGQGGSSQRPDQATGKNGAEPDDGDERQPSGPKDLRPKEPAPGASGDSGAGQNSQSTNQDGQLEPVENRDRTKTQQPDTSNPQPPDDPSPTMDKRQSDSKGGASGDRSGGGKKGPGQGADQAGNDSPGSNSAADEGAGKATESGQGDTSSAPGQKERAEGATGAAGNERGDGASSRSDPNGSDTNQPGQSPQPPSEQRPQDPQGENPSDATSRGPQSGGRGVATGGGLPPDIDTPAGLEKYLEVPPGDEANLEYTRRATNLVLEYLKDQRENPNRELLQELGWTPDELASFLKRWQELKQAAQDDPARARELEEGLRSLGLQPQRDRRRQGSVQSDTLRGLRDEGARSTPPPSYQDLFDAFKKGTARGTPTP